MEKSKLTYYAAKKLSIDRRTIYKWVEKGFDLVEIERVMRTAEGSLLLSPSSAARMVGVTVQTIYRWIFTGKIKCIKLFFGSIRIRKEELIKMDKKWRIQ